MKIKMNNEEKISETALSDFNHLKKKFPDYHRDYIQRDIRYWLKKIIDNKYEIIEKFLDRWDIPYDGFEDGKTCRHWWNTLSPKIKKRRRAIYYFEEEQIVHIKNLHELFITSTPTLPGKRKKVIAGRSLRHLFIYEVEELIADCQIDTFLYYAFENYLLYNEINMNFMFNPGFAITIKTTKGKGDKIISTNIGILLGANIRLMDIKDFAFPIIKHLQTKLIGYKNDPDIISKNDEIDEQLGPDHLPKQKKDTWLVSSGSVRFDERPNLNKNK